MWYDSPPENPSGDLERKPNPEVILGENLVPAEDVKDPAVAETAPGSEYWLP